MEPITQSEYFTRCRAIAVEAVKEAQGDRDVAFDSVHETVDQHEWIIYTYYNLQVLVHSKNENAYFDEVGGPLETHAFSDTMVILAFYAMHADVCEYMDAALTAYAETQPTA